MPDVHPHIPGHEVQLWRDTHWQLLLEDLAQPIPDAISQEIERIFDLLEAQYHRQRDEETGRLTHA